MLVVQRASEQVPAADLLVVESVGPIDRGTTDRHVDWIAACNWIRENTPPDSLWLTPKYQQTFKWYAHRGEVVCWKDVPQDNASVHEWYRRIKRLEPPRTANGYFRDWTDDELLQFADEFGCDYILLDRTYQQSPPERLAVLYPTLDREGRAAKNVSFAVFKVIRP